MVEEEARRIEEDEAHQEEEARHLDKDEARQEEEEEEETTNVEMIDEEEHSNPESSGPRMEADTEGIPLLEIPSPLRRKLSSCSKHPNLRIQRLDLTAPGARPARSWEGWLSYASHPRATLSLRRMRPRHRSLPFSDIV